MLVSSDSQTGSKRRVFQMLRRIAVISHKSQKKFQCALKGILQTKRDSIVTRFLIVMYFFLEKPKLPVINLIFETKKALLLEFCR